MFVFSTRTSLEFFFQPLKLQGNDSVDVMLVGNSDGTVHFSIYDTFIVGTFEVGPPEACLQLRRHASHPAMSTYSLLLTPTEADSRVLHLVPVDLAFTRSFPVNLSLLASKTTTLQKLLRYIKQTQVHMLGEWQSTRELPARFLRSIQAELDEQDPAEIRNIVVILYQGVMMGCYPKVVKEWLLETIGERVSRAAFQQTRVKETDDHVRIAGPEALGESGDIGSGESPRAGPSEHDTRSRAVQHRPQPSHGPR